MFEAAITADPAHVKAMGNLAAVRIGAARHAEAVALLERALSVSEMEQGKLVADLAVALGGAHEAAGGGAGAVGSKDSLEAAHRAYSRALRAHPSHAGAAAQVAALVRIAPRGGSHCCCMLTSAVAFLKLYLPLARGAMWLLYRLLPYIIWLLLI